MDTGRQNHVIENSATRGIGRVRVGWAGATLKREATEMGKVYGEEYEVYFEGDWTGTYERLIDIPRGDLPRNVKIIKSSRRDVTKKWNRLYE